MRAWWVAVVSGLTACAGVSPDPAAMASDLPLPADISAERAAALQAESDRALAALRAGDVDRAREIVDGVLASDPAQARARAVLAHCLMQIAIQESPPTLAVWRRAEGELRRASRLAPEDPVVARLHAVFLAADGHVSAAAERVDTGLAAAPDDRDLLELGARLRYDLGDEIAAIPILERLISLIPNDADSVWRLAQCHARLAPSEVSPGERRSRFDSAVATFTRYRRLSPDDPDGALAEAQTRIARMTDSSGVDPVEVDTILELYRVAARLRPESPESPFGQGAVLELAGRHEEARGAYRAALALDPAHVPSLLNLAASLAAAGDRDAAEPLLERALELGVTADERTRIEAFLAGR